MPTEINDSFMNNSSTPLDAKYSKKVNGLSVPYTSVSDVNVNIPSAYRTVGLTVLVSEGGVNAEYWYKNGTTNDMLIRKYPDAIALTTNLSSGPATLINGILNIPNYATNSVSGVTSFNSRNGDVSLTSGDINTTLGFTPIGSSSLTWSNITGKPTFGTVATSNSYPDLSNKPTIPAQVNLMAGSGINITGTYPNLTISAPPSGTNGGTVTNVSGVSNRTVITGSSTTTPTVDISATYAGQSSISTLGTITAGTWNGTPITNSYLQNNSITLQYGTSGTDVNVGGPGVLGGVLQFNIPVASASNAKGLLSGTDWAAFNNKQNPLSTGTAAQYRKGDNTLGNFPTDLSSFTNQPGYILPAGVKTVNGNTILGSGDVAIINDAASGTGTAYSSSLTETKLSAKANLASPSLTGVPLAPTAAPGTNSTQVSTTAFVQGEIGANKTLFNTQNFSGLGTAGSPVNIVADTTPVSGSSKPIQSGAVYTALLAKQNTLQSGVTIKTVNNQSLLGSGNIDITGGGGSAATTDLLYATDYGMVGDGTTVNSTATVQSFFNAVSSTGKVGVFQSGTYVVASDGTLEIKSNTILIGHNATLQLNAGTGSTRYLVRIYPQKSNISIRGVTLDGNGSNNSGSNIAPFLVEDNVTNLSLEDCRFMGSKDNAGLTIKGSATQNSQVSIVKCSFDLVGRSAIELRGVRNSVIERCYFTNWGYQSGHTGDSPAIQLQSIPSTDVKIVNNTFFNTLSTEFAIESAGSVGSGFILEGLVIDNNFFIDSTTSGTSGGTGISGYFNDSTFTNNKFIKGSNNHHSGFEVFGSGNTIEGNLLQAGSIVVSTGSVINQNVSKIKVVNNTITCAATNGSAIVVAGYNTYSISDVDIEGNYISTVGGSGNSSAIKVGTYATTAPAREINIFGNTIYSSAYGLRLEAASGSQDIYIRDNTYKQGNQFIAVLNNNLSNTQAIDNRNETVSGDLYNAVTPTNPVIFYTTITAAERASFLAKQDALVSAGNIKTVNGASILGSGNLVISGGSAISLAFYDLKGDGGAMGNGTTDDTSSIQAAINTATAQGRPLYVPPGNYVVKGTVYMRTGLTMIGAGRNSARFIYDINFSGANEMFLGIGLSNVYIRSVGFSSTGVLSTSKNIKAILGFNSHDSNDTQCSNITVEDCNFENLWSTYTINFGATASGETHTNDLVTVKYCRFKNIFHPSYQVVTNDSDPKCDAINLQQTTLRAEVCHNTFENVSGHGIFGWGYGITSAEISPNPFYGNWQIHHNSFRTNWMFIEVNGKGLGRGLEIHDNYGWNPTRNTGFAISIAGYQTKTNSNLWELYNRTGCEYRGVECTWGINDKVVIRPYVDRGTPTTGTIAQVDGYEVYGFNNNVYGEVIYEYNDFGGTKPNQLNGIHLCGINTETGLAGQPSTWNGLTNAGNIKISVTVRNHMTYGVFADTNVFENVSITGSDFRSPIARENVIQVYGYNWIVKNNVFDTRNTTSVSNIINTFASQSSDSNSIFTENIIMDNRWGISGSSNIVSYNNQLRASSGVLYTLYPYPPATQAERNSVTPSEGMVFYQTDWTRGPYMYINGSWVNT